MVTTPLTPAEVTERIEVAAIRAFPGTFERKIDQELEKLTIYGDKLLCFEIRDKEHRDAVKNAAKMIDLYEKAIDPDYDVSGIYSAD
mgnify:CR=1 FL=1